MNIVYAACSLVERPDAILKKTHLLKYPELEDVHRSYESFSSNWPGECRYDNFNDCSPHITFGEDLTDAYQRSLRNNRADEAHKTKDNWEVVAEEAGLGHCAW